MGTLSFFPWMTVTKPYQVGECSLVPVSIQRNGALTGDVDAGAAQDVLRVLAPYRMPPNVPLRSATLIRMPGKTVTEDLDNDDIADVFALGEAVAFVGLSARCFFDYGGYNNRDSFTAIVQKFDRVSGGAALRHRRRDGGVLGYWPEQFFKVVKEPHVEKAEHFTLDAEFATAVHRAMLDDEQFDRAVRSFNEANTDRPSLTEVQELISTVSAFQQFLDVPGGNVKETRDKFLAAMATVPVGAVAPSNAAVAAKLPKHNGLRDTWMADLCNLRGSVGHGHRVDRYPALWTPKHHLLLAAHVFPLLVKLQLSAKGALKLTNDDKFGLAIFDRLLAADDVLGAKRDEHGVADSYSWNEVWSSGLRDNIGNW